jgi:HSP20 family protein
MSLPTRVNRTMQYDPAYIAQREFDSIFGRLLGPAGNDSGYVTPYGVDVREDKDHFYVDAELPGFKKDEIDVTLENQTLTISGQRKTESQSGNGTTQHLLRERRTTRFQRSFKLPPTVDERTVNAALNDGILTVTLNKREESKPRKIQVG